MIDVVLLHLFCDLAPESHYRWCCWSPAEYPVAEKTVTAKVTAATEGLLVSMATGSVLEMDPEETKYLVAHLACPMTADDSLANGSRSVDAKGAVTAVLPYNPGQNTATNVITAHVHRCSQPFRHTQHTTHTGTEPKFLVWLLLHLRQCTLLKRNCFAAVCW